MQHSQDEILGHVYDFYNSIRESQWHQPSFSYGILHKVIERHDGEATVNNKPKCQYDFWSYVLIISETSRMN